MPTVNALITGAPSSMDVPRNTTPACRPGIGDWGQLDQSFRLLAHIDEARCVHCNLCYAACTDGAHQAIRLEGTNGTSHLVVEPDYCVGCRLCQYVCPVDGCITFEELEGAAAIH